MFRVRAVSVLTLGLLIAASTQAQQPGPYMNGPMPMPAFGPGPQMMPPQSAPYGMAPQGFDPAYAQAMYDASMGAPYGVAPMQYPGDVPQPIIAGDPSLGGDCGCGCEGPCMGDCGCSQKGGCFQKGGCHGGCMPCCEPCPPPCCPIVCSVEVEATFLMMDLSGTQVAGQLDAPAIPVGALFLSSDADLEDEITHSPRLYFNCQKCEWGLGVRVWNLDDSASNYTPLNLLNLNIIGNYSLERIEACYADTELTYSLSHGSCHYGLLKNSSLQLAVGLRYAEYENESLMIANGSFGDAIAHSSGIAQVRYDGTGITSGIRGTFGLKHHTALYWGLRGSYLWGDMTTLAQTAATAIYEVDPAAGAINSAGTSTDEELFIGEATLGLQWQHQLRCIPACAFFRVAAEYQLWDINSDAFSYAESVVEVDVLPADSIISSAQALAGSPKVDLFGLTVATGFTW